MSEPVVSTETPRVGNLVPSNPNGSTSVVSLETVKRKRGRPPGSGNKKALAIKGNEKPDTKRKETVAPARPQRTEADCAFFVETVLSLIEGGDELLKRWYVDKLRQYKVAADDVAAFEDTLKKTNLNEADKKMLRTQLTALAMKYDFLAKIGPEIGLAAWLVQYGARQYGVLKCIQSMRPKVEKPTS